MEKNGAHLQTVLDTGQISLFVLGDKKWHGESILS